jgi:hypothetical protein
MADHSRIEWTELPDHPLHDNPLPARGERAG